MPCTRVLQKRHTCLFARQAARQVPHHHIAPSCATTHPNVGGMHRYSLGLPVFDYLQRPTKAPSPKQSAVLMERTAARGALLGCYRRTPFKRGKKESAWLLVLKLLVPCHRWNRTRSLVHPRRTSCASSSCAM